MDIEDEIERKAYRGFDLVHLREGKAVKTRWHITRKESGMNRSYGFVVSEEHAQAVIDELIGKEPNQPRID